jgi:hypothetical protein
VHGFMQVTTQPVQGSDLVTGLYCVTGTRF